MRRIQQLGQPERDLRKRKQEAQLKREQLQTLAERLFHPGTSIEEALKVTAPLGRNGAQIQQEV